MGRSTSSQAARGNALRGALAAARRALARQSSHTSAHLALGGLFASETNNATAITLILDRVVLAGTHSLDGALTPVARAVSQAPPAGCAENECHSRARASLRRPWRPGPVLGDSRLEEAQRWAVVVGAMALAQMELHTAPAGTWPGASDQDPNEMVPLPDGSDKGQVKARRELVWLLCAAREALGVHQQDHRRWGERWTSLDPEGDKYVRSLDRDRRPTRVVEQLEEAVFGGATFPLLPELITVLLEQMGLAPGEKTPPTSGGGRAGEFGGLAAYGVCRELEDEPPNAFQRLAEEYLESALLEARQEGIEPDAFWQAVVDRLDALAKRARPDEREAGAALLVARRMRRPEKRRSWWSRLIETLGPQRSLVSGLVLATILTLLVARPWQVNPIIPTLKGADVEAELFMGNTPCSPERLNKTTCQWSIEDDLRAYVRREDTSKYRFAALAFLDSGGDLSVLALGPIRPSGAKCPDGWCQLFGAEVDAPAGEARAFVVFDEAAMTEPQARERASLAAALDAGAPPLEDVYCFTLQVTP